MESFSLAATHGGAINHVHTVQIGASAAEVMREARMAITVIVMGWIVVTGIRAMSARERQSSK